LALTTEEVVLDPLEGQQDDQLVEHARHRTLS
jgi:hypothetical protein